MAVGYRVASLSAFGKEIVGDNSNNLLTADSRRLTATIGEKQMYAGLKSDQSGLTLIELTIVIVILGILAAFIAPRVINAPQQAKVAKAQTEVNGIKTALEQYAIATGEYPTTEQGLSALWRAPSPAPANWDGPYIDSPNFVDPWSNPYVYRQPSTHYGYDYDLYSMGKDGKVGGTELDADITNWVDETTGAY